MDLLAQACESIASTPKKLEKTSIVAAYFKSRTLDEAAVSAVFLSGGAFPAWEPTTLQLGGRSLWQLVAELSENNDSEITAAYRRLGDLGAVAGDVLPARAGQGLYLLEVESTFRHIASARGPAAKTALVRDLLARATPLEAKYIIKIITGDLRIGLKESLVEEAIANAYSPTVSQVQRANMLLGDIGQTVRLAAQGKLAEAKMRLFHPLGFMLASPIESPAEGLSYFAEAAVEDKYDGIRAQAHVSEGEVKLFSRTRDEITESFPELPGALAALPRDAVLDGEIVAWEYPSDAPHAPPIVDRVVDPADQNAHPFRSIELGRARPFSVLQQRLGRREVSDQMLRETPVAFLVFDLLYADGQLLIDRPLRDRARILDELLAHRQNPRPRSREAWRKTGQAQFVFEEDAIEDGRHMLLRAPVFGALSTAELEQLFAAARARGNEGLMIKDRNSPYTPGKRGKSWLKMKRELATLDVVVTAVEYGHGKRIGVLSDYTFAVWDRASGAGTDKEGTDQAGTDKDAADQARLVNIGKAYSGLTDSEIAALTTWFLAHTIPDQTSRDQGFRLLVEPKIVLEVAFNNLMRSDRHDSGYALRFPRIVRLRPDKSAEDADTLARVKEIYAQQRA